jgi:hypothetical protein
MLFFGRHFDSTSGYWSETLLELQLIPFSFQPVQELLDFDIDVSSDDVLHNLVTKDTQMMRGTTPWRGSREKDPLLLQMLNEATTSPGDIVMECLASTGLIMHFKVSIYTCLQVCCYNSSVHFIFLYYHLCLLQGHLYARMSKGGSAYPGFRIR